jgi:DNA-binding NtrC family response regulator
VRAVEVEGDAEGSRRRGALDGKDEDDSAGDGREGRFRVGMSLEDLERMAIASTLEAVGGNRRRAAQMLGIGERTLYRKIKEYELV